MKLTVNALFGGSFDPPHYGHFKPIQSLVDEFAITCVHYLLSAKPPHKTPLHDNQAHRKNMLQLACAEYANCQANFTEFGLRGPSFTVNTLSHLRKQLTHESIVFIMGIDSFANIQTWYRWQVLLDLAHIIVLPRPGFAFDPDANLQVWIENHRETDASCFHQSRNGALFFAETPLWDVSSTYIRQLIAAHQSDEHMLKQKLSALLSPAVLDYVCEHKLYKTESK